MLQRTDRLCVQSAAHHAKAIPGESEALECVARTLLARQHWLWRGRWRGRGRRRGHSSRAGHELAANTARETKGKG